MTNALGVFVVFAVFLAENGINGNIGKCDLSSPPTSWLSTNASGILQWATAGQPTNGINYCIDMTNSESGLHILQVAYHIDLGEESSNSESSEIPEKVDHNFFGGALELGSQNGCVNNNTRIVYCFALCLNQTLQNMVIESALKSNQVAFVAQDIQKTTQLDWAITVMQVDYNDPSTHLNVSSFLRPDAWCSVYVGIKPKLGFDYLYEIQLGKILKN
ncbi:Protein CBG10557 [Caenorhabditis briggsae]|uniref:DOMON domain-containing protein n=2 Tax=Caenorhabditis briggsae TaxID=6238 RepID=A0AAE9IKM0_CAEBR|nr:Protein CBG10557 [Caenorhabditis briggsae]ULT97948.1 hypothetical protein L3Y34_005646 [Caenorhabditis briggsae]CAP29947.1 Protein CBG10557 [Caenorhabditis briggsae]